MSLHKPLLDWITYYMPDWRQRCRDGQSACKRRLREIKIRTITLFALYLAAALCFMLVFGMVNYFWFTFRNTPVGSMFLAANPPEAIMALLTATNSSNLVGLAFRLTFDTVVTCLLLGLICQLFAITRYFYLGRGMINRLVWYGICAAVTGLDFLEQGNPFDFTTSFALYLLPASLLSRHCLEFTALLLPEIWIVFRMRELREVIKIARIRNNQNLNDSPR